MVVNCCAGAATFAAIVDDYSAPRERFLADVTALLSGLADKRSSWNCDHQTVMPRTRGTCRVPRRGPGSAHDEREFDMAENGAALYKPLERPIVIERHEVGGAASGKSGGFLALDWCRGRRSFGWRLGNGSCVVL